MEQKQEKKETKPKKEINYNPILKDLSKAMLYSFLTGVCMAAGGHAYAAVFRPSRGKLLSIEGGRKSA